MQTELVPMTPLLLCHIEEASCLPTIIRISYFAEGCVSYCVLEDGKPVFAGGVVDMHWSRGEAWILPTTWFRSHIKTCFHYMQDVLPMMAIKGNFKRIQATCPTTVSPSLFEHLGFTYEGIMDHFGPNGERCYMYAKIF